MVNKCIYNVVFIENYDIIFEGIVNILLKNKDLYSFYRFKNLKEFIDYEFTEEIELLFINTILLIDENKKFKKLISSIKSTKKIALVTNVTNYEILREFDEIIYFIDSTDVVIEKINNLLKAKNILKQSTQLTKREEEVLLYLISGFSNKEISNKLNISIHTVITHRKNISEKLGIKSTAGLVLYAITKGLKPLLDKQ